VKDVTAVGGIPCPRHSLLVIVFIHLTSRGFDIAGGNCGGNFVNGVLSFIEVFSSIQESMNSKLKESVATKNVLHAGCRLMRLDLKESVC